MAKSRANRSIAKILKLLKDSKSNQYREIKKVVNQLNEKNQRLTLCFVNRANDRETAAQQSANNSQKEAEDALSKAEYVVKNEEKNHGQASPAAMHDLKFRKSALETRIQSGKVEVMMAAWANKFDKKLMEWHDQLVGACVESVYDENAIERVITILSFGIAAAGFAPHLALPAGVAGLSLAADDLRKKYDIALAMRKEDKRMAQLDGALILLNFAKDLTTNWLQILKCK